MAGMRVMRFMPPYQAPRKTTFVGARWKAGVYVIRENGVIVYVGYAGECIYRTLYRHFQNWTDKSYRSNKVAPPPYRVSYRLRMAANDYTVRVIYCSKKQAARLERLLILKYNPRDNMIKYEAYQRDSWDSRVEKEFEVVELREECPF